MLPGDETVTSICIPFGKANDLVIKEAYKYYDIVRLFGYRSNFLADVKEKPMDAYPILNKTEVDQVIRWIDRAVEEKKVITLMLHGIAHDTSDKGDYYFSDKKLRDILAYVSSLGKNKLIPVTLRDLPNINPVEYTEKKLFKIKLKRLFWLKMRIIC